MPGSFGSGLLLAMMSCGGGTGCVEKSVVACEIFAHHPAQRSAIRSRHRPWAAVERVRGAVRCGDVCGARAQRLRVCLSMMMQIGFQTELPCLALHARPTATDDRPLTDSRVL